MLANPNFGAVVFEQQWALEAICSHHSGPTKPRVSLINKVRIGTLNQRHSTTRKNQVVVNIEKRSRAAAGLRRDNSETIVATIKARNLIVADYPPFHAERFESFNNTLDVTRSATCLCAGSGCRAQKDH